MVSVLAHIQVKISVLELKKRYPSSPNYYIIDIYTEKVVYMLTNKKSPHEDKGGESYKIYNQINTIK